MNRLRTSFALALLFAVPLLLVACGGSEPAEVDEAPAEAVAEEPAAPKAFFVEPADGATVGTEVILKFGVSDFVIEPVGDGMVHAGHGHFHVGLDTECLPAGVVIPTADPWIHFGDGSAEIDMGLTPGEHTLTLQIGDGEHRTLDEPGLCTTITVTAVEEAAEGA